MNLGVGFLAVHATGLRGRGILSQDLPDLKQSQDRAGC